MMRIKLVNTSTQVFTRSLCSLSVSSSNNQPHRISRYLLLTRKPKVEDKDSKSYLLLRQYGFIDTISSGLHNLLPLCTRSLNKLTNLVDQEMESCGGQRISLPSLGYLELLRKTGKWSDERPDIFTFKDRHGTELYLAPTHEEIICHWLSQEKITEKKLPIYFYQITPKFRDEARPRSGLIRGKEFIMKDLYTFDLNETNAKKTYDIICQSYQNIFDKLKVKVIKVTADPGLIGGKYSHEYHLVSDIGEDSIYVCSKCDKGYSEEYIQQNPNQSKHCSSCNTELTVKLSIEVGHAFYLATRYTEPFKCYYRSKENKTELLQMGCYGLGITRILASCLEILSNNRQLRWPSLIAPYQVCVIPPKVGSKESNQKANQLAEDIANQLAHLTSADVVIDDRTELTIGNRMFQCSCWGIPLIIAVGKKSVSQIPLFDVISINGQDSKTEELSHLQLLDKVKTMFPKR